VEDFVGQRIILFKELPSSDYLADMVERGVLRAGMTFLPGSCYAGAGIYPETTMYATSGSLPDAAAADACPYENDPVRCLQWEIEQTRDKYSLNVPQEFNAFVFAQVRSGSREEWGNRASDLTREMVAESEELVAAGKLPREEYVSIAHLIGCGPYNVGFEVLTADHARLQRYIRRLTDMEFVEDVMVGHLAAADAIGFGEGEVASSS